MDNLAQSVDGGHSLRLHLAPTAWAGLPHRPTTGGAPEPPQRFAPPTFEISQKPENRRRTRARNPLRLGDRGHRGPVREGAPGGWPWGLGCKPLPGSALGAAGDRASEARKGHGRPLRAVILKGEQLCAAMYSESTFLQSGRAGATLGGMKYAILRTQKLKATGAVWRS